MKSTRRSFLTTSSAAVTFSALSAGRVVGANERLRLGAIGMGGRGGSVNPGFAAISGVEVGAVCDADKGRAEGAAKKFKGSKAVTDLRRVIDDKDIDFVTVTTCNHWHVLASVWACQAGKDVYVEKPVSHNIWEGRKLVEASRKYDRIVQGGTQQRSDELQGKVKAYLDSGKLGKIKYVRCNRYGQRASIGKRKTPLTPPEGVDYDLWLGPAKEEPIFREKLHYDWHWDWNTGNGELGNWGPHVLDDLRNVVFRDKVKLPKRVLAGGGRLAWHDGGNTPNTHFMYIDTGDIPVIMDVHNLPRKKGQRAGDTYTRRKTGGFLVIECENGYYAGGRGGGAAYDKAGKKIDSFKGTGGRGHFENFIKAVRSRKREDQNAEIEEIHYSSAWCHLGNISWRLGAEDSYDRDKATAAIKSFQPWNDVIEDFENHIGANEINMAKEDVRLGALLEIDAEKETFIGDSATPEALALLTREYRKGFEVPDKV
jgi:predicted dehydrogenase